MRRGCFKSKQPPFFPFGEKKVDPNQAGTQNKNVLLQCHPRLHLH